MLSADLKMQDVFNLMSVLQLSIVTTAPFNRWRRVWSGSQWRVPHKSFSNWSSKKVEKPPVCLIGVGLTRICVDVILKKNKAEKNMKKSTDWFPLGLDRRFISIQSAMDEFDGAPILPLEPPSRQLFHFTSPHHVVSGSLHHAGDSEPKMFAIGNTEVANPSSATLACRLLLSIRPILHQSHVLLEKYMLMISPAAYTNATTLKGKASVNIPLVIDFPHYF